MVESSVGTEHIVTHTICEDCANALFAANSPNMETFLDTLAEPVLVVDADVVVLAANRSAEQILGKKIPAIKGFKGGNVIECIHAHEPGGCGKTMHCDGCTIRLTVTDTYKTGRVHMKVPAYAKISLGGKPVKADILISTEKVEGVVVLRLDKITTGEKTGN